MTDDVLLDSSRPPILEKRQSDTENPAEAVHRPFAPFGGVDDLTPQGLAVFANHDNPFEANGHMQHKDFTIGEAFWCSAQKWRCTDIGTRTITAIKLDHEDDPSWYNGPPYAVAEAVFDEYDIEGCTKEADPQDIALSSPAPAAVLGIASEDAWDSPEGKVKRVAQAKELREQARAGGLSFEAYLPSRLADWLLGLIERGTFRDPSEAVFVILGEHEELEPHADLRQELLRRRLQIALDDPRPSIPGEEMFERMMKELEKPRSRPAVWPKS